MVPQLVFQDEVTRKRTNATWGTVKAAVLKNDSRSSILIITSCYDQKPFYTISYCISNVSWIKCSKLIWSNQFKKVINYKFLRWNISDNYNFEISNNGLGNQLKLLFCMQRFHRNGKWLWALWIWGIEGKDTARQRECVPYLHHDFLETVGMAYLDSTIHWPWKKSLPEHTRQLFSHNTTISCWQETWFMVRWNACCTTRWQRKSCLPAP